MTRFKSTSDKVLVQQYIDGDNASFDELLERYQSKIFSYIFFMVKDQDMANDIFQDTFVKAILKLRQGKYEDNGRFSFWIMTIAHNLIMDGFRANKIEQISDINEDNDLRKIEGGDIIDGVNKENELINEQIFIDVKRLMNNLPDQQREVVYMRYYQDMPFKEIAKITGVSINTSLGRMRYAIINMRRMAKKHNINLSIAV